MLTLRARRLLLVAADAELSRAEADPVALGRLLRAEVPAGWPPLEMVAAIGAWSAELAVRPELRGWTNWYWLRREEPTVVGYGGFKGPADPHGMVEVGFAVLEPYQRRGYAAEALDALLRWALEEEAVTSVLAETTEANQAAQQLLSRLRFRRLVDLEPPDGAARYLLSREL